MQQERAAHVQHLLLNWYQGMGDHWCPRSCPFSPHTNPFLPSSSVVSQLEELRWGNVNHVCWGAILHQLHFLRWLSQNWSGSRGLGTSVTESTWGQRSGTLGHLCFSTTHFRSWGVYFRHDQIVKYPKTCNQYRNSDISKVLEVSQITV